MAGERSLCGGEQPSVRSFRGLRAAASERGLRRGAPFVDVERDLVVAARTRRPIAGPTDVVEATRFLPMQK